jgi:hypothetical protein
MISLTWRGGEQLSQLVGRPHTKLLAARKGCTMAGQKIAVQKIRWLFMFAICLSGFSKKAGTGSILNKTKYISLVINASPVPVVSQRFRVLFILFVNMIPVLSRYRYL